AKPAIERALDEIVNSNGSLTIKEIVARHGISREHFTRVFSARHKMPPARYIARVRLARAIELLGATQLPVAAIAKQCGFGAKQSLFRWMQRETGRLPSEFRRRRVKLSQAGPANRGRLLIVRQKSRY